MTDPRLVHPLAEQHPRALRLCMFLRKVRFWCALVAFVGMLGEIVLLDAMRRHQSAASLYAGLKVCGVMFGAGICALIAACALRFLIVLLFFTQYSLRQLLGLIILGGTCGTLIAKLPGLLKVLPASFLVGLLLLAFLYVLNQDPTGAAITPSFVSLVVRRRKLAAVLKKRQAAKNAEKTTDD